MQAWNLLHAARWKTQGAKKSPKSRHLHGHHRTTLSGYIFLTKARIDNWKKLLSSNMSSICPHNMVNFGLLAAEIGLPVWGTPPNFNGFRSFASWQRYCTACSSERQPNFAALNRGRHLCSAGRPSRWALAHISSLRYLTFGRSRTKSRSFSLTTYLFETCGYSFGGRSGQLRSEIGSLLLVCYNVVCFCDIIL